MYKKIQILTHEQNQCEQDNWFNVEYVLPLLLKASTRLNKQVAIQKLVCFCANQSSPM